DKEVGAVFAILLAIQVTTDREATVSYYVEGVFKGYVNFGPGGATKLIFVPLGSHLQLEVVSGHKGFRVEWDIEGHSELRTTDPIFRSGGMDREFHITAVFIKTDSDAGFPLELLALLAATVALWLLIFLLWGRQRPIITGIIKCGEEELPDAKVEYTIKKHDDPNPPAVKFVRTDADGRYVINAFMKADVVIISVTRAGSKVAESLPITFFVEQKVTEQNFSMKEK
ncbi:MAG: hypothetical protein LBI08_00085, partial [Methanomassiliicoccaceae archaeon]|nr:hypothetical protein [Methanomassiliicoccaceae archaeon]